MKRVLFFVLLFVPFALQAEDFTRTEVLMGDVPVAITIKTKPSRRDAAFEAMDRAFGEVRRLTDSISEWQPTSQTSRLNQNAGKAWVPIDGEMTDLLLKAREISELTQGAFDITFASRKRSVSYRDVVIVPEFGLAALKQGVTIGVSGIAKGFIVDKMTAVLRRSGFTAFLVNAGDIYAAGRWEIGIRDPERPGSSQALCTLTIRDQAVSTSGLYERGDHIINPKTRKPAKTLKSVTVISETSTQADALATAFFILGEKRAGEILKKYPKIRAIFVRSDTSAPLRSAPLPTSRTDECRRS